MPRPTEKDTTQDRGSQTHNEKDTGIAARSPTGGESERPINVSSETGAREHGRALARRQDPFARGLSLNPFEMMRRMSDEMSRLFSTTAPASVLPQQLGAFDFAGLSSWTPQIEVAKDANAVRVRADLPGLKPDDVKVSVDDDVLTIAGERRQEHKEKDDGYVRTEVSYGAFTRAIPLPDGADEDRIAASFKDGVLEITVPLSGKERGRRIPIKASN